LSVTSESYAKADEPIEMPFSVLISEAQGTYILPGAGSSHGRGALLGGRHSCAFLDLLAVDILHITDIRGLFAHSSALIISKSANG